ncbi:hypothetical protein ACNHUS_01565 [Actinomycetes bacterium M1A6_2h]
MPVQVDFEMLEGLSRTERVEHIRRRIASSPAAEKSVLPVPPPLASLLPHGGLVRGSVVSVSGAGSLLVGMLASVTGSGRHAAVIGCPRLGLLAATEHGADLSRCAWIPEPGDDPVEIAAVLLDGLDLVVLGLGGASVPPSRTRAVIARARNKGSTLIVTDGQWDGAELRLDARVDGYGGLGAGSELGHGRVRSLRLAVQVSSRSSQPRIGHFDVASAGGRVEWTENRRPQLAAI